MSEETLDREVLVHAGSRPSPPEEAWGLLRGHVLLTGATGFVGQAVLERLLTDHPDVGITALVRGHRGASAAGRLAGLAGKPVFRELRERVGLAGVRDLLAERVRPLEADLAAPGEVAGLPEDLTVLVHCASTVSFDPPVDEAFRINVAGPAALYRAAAALPGRPHLVHVSTAFVSALRPGAVPEAALDHDVDWPAELRHALAAGVEAEQASRLPAVLGPLLAAARDRLGKAGALTAAAAAEEERRAWVTRRLVDAGRLRAQVLGWTDVYTFTKALGERVAEGAARDGGLPLTVVRPTIVQSAVRRPYPGWYDSHKMMDPIILSYARGDVPEFPVRPDGVIDLVPVDVVTAATVAVAARPAPPPGAPAYLHVGTGHRNPLTQRDLHREIRGYFREHPLPAPGGRGHVSVPAWTFPRAGVVAGRLRAAERAVELGDRALRALPGTDRTRAWRDELHRTDRRVRSLRRLYDLYGAYGEVEARYTDDGLAALAAAAPAGWPGREDLDPTTLDWPHYLREVYCPGLAAVARRGAGGPRPARRGGVLPAGGDRVAIFDLEGTVLSSTLVEAYLWAWVAQHGPSAWPRHAVSLAAAVPGYLRSEHADRGDFIRTFVRRYAGAREDELRELVGGRLGDAYLQRTRPGAVRRIREHRAAGHRTVLVTGAAELFVEPLRPVFDEVVACRLEARDGVLTGYLAEPPVVGEARGRWAVGYAAAAGLDLGRSWAYGDSWSDRALLEAVGHPVAVNPDAPLHRHARTKAWPVEDWGAHTLGRLDPLLTALAGSGRR